MSQETPQFSDEEHAHEERYAIEKMQPAEYTGLFHRMAQSLLHIRTLLSRIIELVPNAISWLSLGTPTQLVRGAIADVLDEDQAQDVHRVIDELEKEKQDFLEAKERLPHLVIETNTKVMRGYFGALQEIFGQIGDQPNISASERRFADMMGQMFSKVRTKSIIAAPSDRKGQSMTLTPIRASFSVNHGEEQPLASLFQQSLREHSLPELLFLSRRLANFLWTQNSARYITNAEVRSQIPLLVEALHTAIEQQISNRQQHDPSSPHPQQRLRSLDQVGALTGVPGPALPSRFANTVIDFLRNEMEVQAEEGQNQDLRSARYQAGWEKRKSLNNTALPFPSARNRAEADGDRLVNAVLPAGMSAVDLFNPAYHASALARTAEGDSTRMVDVLKGSSLTELLSLKSKTLGSFQGLKKHIGLWTVPSSLTHLELFDYRMLVNRLIMVGNPLNKAEYYANGGGAPEQQESAPELEDMELWYLYYELRRALQTADSLQELSEMLLPGIDADLLIPPGKGKEHSASLLKKRFQLLAHSSDTFFRALGKENISLLTHAVFNGLATLSAEEWRATELFAHMKTFAQSSMLPPHEEHEEAIRAYIHQKYTPLLSSPQDVQQKYHSADAVGRLIQPLRQRESSLRLALLEHLAQNDKRIRDQEGFVVPDVGEDLPFGDIVEVQRAIRIFFVRTGIISMAFYPLPQQEPLHVAR